MWDEAFVVDIDIKAMSAVELNDYMLDKAGWIISQSHLTTAARVLVTLSISSFGT
jgi:hypothetical protein